MIETLTAWLAFLGWSADNVLAIVNGAVAATVAGWIAKYPLRVYCDAHGIPLPTFKWLVRIVTGVAAIVATELSWPVRGRAAWFAGLLAWVAITLIYRYSAPLLTKFFPWISTDALAKPDDSDEAGA
ncbi:MAG TPA: hypothetical protein PLX85_00020 [Dehalococcoidia bacterium]|nr:hypothetical protein [Dehalococcoidia bacterium]